MDNEFIKELNPNLKNDDDNFTEVDENTKEEIENFKKDIKTVVLENNYLLLLIGTTWATQRYLKICEIIGKIPDNKFQQCTNGSLWLILAASGHEDIINTYRDKIDEDIAFKLAAIESLNIVKEIC